MSAYVTQDIGASTVEGIVEALIDAGFPREVIEVHQGAAVNLYGYQGDQRATQAHIVVRRADVTRHMGYGAPNDIGFERLPSGKWREHVSRADQGWWQRDVGGGQTRAQRFRQAKAFGELIAQARRQGVRVQIAHTTDREGRRVVRLRASDPLESGARSSARAVSIR